MRTIQIINQSTVVNDADFQAAVAACQRQANEHFAPAWGGLAVALQTITADIAKPLVYETPSTGTTSVNPGAETIYILDDADQQGVLGYHELSADVPVGFVFAKTTAADDQAWQVTLSHELLEQLADPYCATCAVVAFGPGSGRHGHVSNAAVEYEVCDPVENDQYMIDGVPVSNFVLPAWFQPATGAVGPYDYLQKLHAPLTMTAGGYIGYTTDLKSWKQTAQPQRAHHYARKGKRTHAKG